MKNMNPTDYVHCCVIGCHGNSFGLNKKKVSCEGLLWGGGVKILKHLYLNDYAEFNSKISHIMFFTLLSLACEISTIRTLALKYSSHITEMLLNLTYCNTLACVCILI